MVTSSLVAASLVATSLVTASLVTTSLMITSSVVMATATSSLMESLPLVLIEACLILVKPSKVVASATPETTRTTASHCSLVTTEASSLVLVLIHPLLAVKVMTLVILIPTTSASAKSIIILPLSQIVVVVVVRPWHVAVALELVWSLLILSLLSLLLGVTLFD